MTLKPLFENILVKLEEKQETGGIVMGDKPFGELVRAKIIDIGEGELSPSLTATQVASGVTNIPIPLKVNTYVYFQKSSAKLLTFEGEEFYLLDWRHVYAKEE